MRLENAESFVRATPDEILAKVGEIIEKETIRTNLFDAAALENMPRFWKEEIQTGRVVGRGGFAVVREITSVHLREETGEGAATTTTTTTKQHSSARLFRRSGSGSGSTSNNANESGTNASKRDLLARHVWCKRTTKYVLKEVEPELLQNDTVTYLKGVIDLGLEAYYLASLNHNNILKIRGISAIGPSEGLRYFIILDQLSEILSKKLNTWMHQKRATNGITGAVTGGRRHKKRLLMERVLVAYDIADALDYIHRENIIYRDLKHDNIGFDADGILKLFDFGLAKELQESERDEDGLYRMTGLTGALRYMAPEVGLRKPYNQKADVYSWSMLMWYILALEPPLGVYTPRMFLDRVFEKGYRPALKEKWPEELKSLVRISWDENINARPSFEEIKRLLKDFTRQYDPEIASLMGDERSHHDFNVSFNHSASK